MNVLVTNDDGPNAFGLQVLRDAVKKLRRSKTVVIVPKTEQSCMGFAVKTGDVSKLRPQKIRSDFFAVPAATPVDIVNLAFVRAEEFLPKGQTFDLVVSGVNHVQNVGWPILHSGTVAAAVQAAGYYGACGWAFSQAFGPCGTRERPKGDAAMKKAFANSVKYLPGFFSNQKPMPGECWNVNFPYQAVTRGWVQCLVAPYDPYIGTRFTPQVAREHKHDIACLDDGFITRSPIGLSYNLPLNW